MDYWDSVPSVAGMPSSALGQEPPPRAVWSRVHLGAGGLPPQARKGAWQPLAHSGPLYAVLLSANGSEQSVMLHKASPMK